MHTDVSPFQLVSLYQPGRLLCSLGEDWLFLARGQVTQEYESLVQENLLAGRHCPQ